MTWGRGAGAKLSVQYPIKLTTEVSHMAGQSVICDWSQTKTLDFKIMKLKCNSLYNYQTAMPGKSASFVVLLGGNNEKNFC